MRRTAAVIFGIAVTLLGIVGGAALLSLRVLTVGEYAFVGTCIGTLEGIVFAHPVLCTYQHAFGMRWYVAFLANCIAAAVFWPVRVICFVVWCGIKSAESSTQ